MVQRKFPEAGKCRTCQCPWNGPSTDLYQDCFKGQTYEEILRIKLSVKLPKITGASCTICMRCTKLLESVDAFVRQCQLTNDLQALVHTETSVLEQDTKYQMDRQSEVPENDSSQGTACYLDMDCDADNDEDEEFHGFTNDEESSEVPQPPHEVVVKLETEDSANEDFKDHEKNLLLFTSELSLPREPRQRGRGPAWKDECLKQLLEVAKNYRLSDGRMDITAIYLALRDDPHMSRYSREAIKSKLFLVKQMVKKPGMPKIKNRIYESDALELFGGDVES